MPRAEVAGGVLGAVDDPAVPSGVDEVPDRLQGIVDHASHVVVEMAVALASAPVGMPAARLGELTLIGPDGGVPPARMALGAAGPWPWWA